MKENFAEKLATLRAQKGFTQRELGAMAGVAWSMISKYEAGQSMPRLKVLMRLAEALGVTIEELRGGDPKNASGLKIYEGFSARLVNERHKANVSRQKLSELTGMARKEITDLELGVLLPSEDDVHKITNALGIDVLTLAGTKDEEGVVRLHFIEPGEEKEPSSPEDLVAVPADVYRNFLSTAERLGATPGELMMAVISREAAFINAPENEVPSLADFVEKVKSGAI
ncbi:helix-turn-helix domain-containing protein [Pseudomonas sp. SMN5]|uniref:helix-turn-helix domain-containing protein n=1 Tax=Pseudomonas sp. SMN5 TaxID=3390198 RepID=UPI003F83DEF4